jgi:hypothetical protein
MPEPELCLLFVRPLNRLGVRYVVSGSVAAMLYGEPRLTHDVDFVVFLRQDDIGRFRSTARSATVRASMSGQSPTPGDSPDGSGTRRCRNRPPFRRRTVAGCWRRRYPKPS